MNTTSQETVAVVGGGITGLFCAYFLAKNGRFIHLFEAANRLGGRIHSVRLDKNNGKPGDDWKHDDIEFYAEFGPMRIEFDKQLLLKALLDHLSIRPGDPGPASCGADAAHLDPFPPYTSPTMVSDPTYNLRPEEAGKTPLELLQMAMLRIMTRVRVRNGRSNFMRRRKDLISALC